MNHNDSAFGTVMAFASIVAVSMATYLFLEKCNALLKALDEKGRAI